MGKAIDAAYIKATQNMASDLDMSGYNAGSAIDRKYKEAIQQQELGRRMVAGTKDLGMNLASSIGKYIESTPLPVVQKSTPQNQDSSLTEKAITEIRNKVSGGDYSAINSLPKDFNAEQYKNQKEYDRQSEVQRMLNNWVNTPSQTGSFVSGAADAVTFGVLPYAIKTELPALYNKMQVSQKEYPKTSMAGEIAGSLVPFGAGAKVAKTGLEAAGALYKGVSTAEKIKNALAIESLAGGLTGATEGLVRGEGVQGTLNRASEYAGLGALGGAALKGLEVGGKALLEANPALKTMFSDYAKTMGEATKKTTSSISDTFNKIKESISKKPLATPSESEIAAATPKTADEAASKIKEILAKQKPVEDISAPKTAAEEVAAMGKKVEQNSYAGKTKFTSPTKVAEDIKDQLNSMKSSKEPIKMSAQDELNARVNKYVQDNINKFQAAGRSMPTSADEAAYNIKSILSGETNPIYKGKKPIVPEYVPKENLAAKIEETPALKQEINAANNKIKDATPKEVVDTVEELWGKQGQELKFTFDDPDLEANYWRDKGVKPASLKDNIAEGLTDLKNKFTRPLADLPVNQKYAQAYYGDHGLIYLNKANKMATDKAVRNLEELTKPFKNLAEEDVLERKIIMNDFAEEVSKGGKLPEGWDAQKLDVETKKLNAMLDQNPELKTKIEDAIAKRKEMWKPILDDYIKANESTGKKLKVNFNREDYFRHQVLEHIDDLKQGFTKARSGEYTGRINMDYLQAEYEVMSKMIAATEKVKVLKNIQDNYDIAAKVKAIAKEKGMQKWTDAIPEGYSLWKPSQGNPFYRAMTVSEELADDLAQKTLKKLGMTGDALGEAFEIKGLSKAMVIPDDLAKTLTNLSKVGKPPFIEKASRMLDAIDGSVKGWMLHSPTRFIKYTIRNLTSDVEQFAFRPSIIKYVKQAFNEVRAAYKSGTFTKDLQDFYELGGFQTGQRVQELSDLTKLSQFSKFRKTSTVQQLNKLPRKYFELTGNITDEREAMQRYAAYLDFKKELKASPDGLPKDYAASKPEIIKGINGIEARAFKMSNDLFGAYDETSEAGRYVAKRFLAFYRWLEVNTTRYNQYFKNAFNDVRATEKVGESFAKSIGYGAKIAGKTAVAVGKLTMRIAAMSGGVALWNNYMFPEEEKDLPPDVKSRPHIVLGRDKDGQVIAFTRIGALNDYLEWFGLGTITEDVAEIMNGEKTLKEQVIEMLKQPLNKVAGYVNPLIKSTVELATGRATYPDITDPRDIKDKPRYIAQALGVEKEYDALVGNPSKPYSERVPELITYKYDPEKVAYDKMKDYIRKYKEKIGKASEGYSESQRSNYLYNIKLALRYKDKEALKKNLVDYAKAGGTEQGLQTSINNMHPLSGLSQKDVQGFLNTLTTKQVEELKKAIKFYEEVIGK